MICLRFPYSLLLAWLSGLLLVGCGGTQADTGAGSESPAGVVVLPNPANTTTSGSVSFAATGTGAAASRTLSVTWSVTAGGGSIGSTTGVYVAPATPGTFVVTATSVADPAIAGTAIVNVSASSGITVSVSPASTSTTVGGVVSFVATVTGVPAGRSTAVTWSVSAGAGSIDASSGRYVAPGVPGSYMVSATSVADPSRSGVGVVEVSPGSGTGTDVAGGNVSGRWTVAGSPYRVRGDVTVPSGANLTIDPGVKVEFQGPHYLKLLGGMRAVGTAASPVVFTTTDADIGRGSAWVGWRGIRISGNSSYPPEHDHGVALYDIRYAEIAYVDKPGNGGVPGNPWEDYEGNFFVNSALPSDIVFDDNYVHHGRNYLFEITQGHPPFQPGVAYTFNRNVFEYGQNAALVSSHNVTLSPNTDVPVHFVGGAVRHCGSTADATVAWAYDVPIFLDGVTIEDCGDRAGAPWFFPANGNGVVTFTPP